ncbi:MAG: hypothetical protein DRJ47_07260 [Thermoprotei archaeon]|nr:MAG: hypothetical protein DRJ47_07260 [Thermoprotei archaeon]
MQEIAEKTLYLLLIIGLTMLLSTLFTAHYYEKLYRIGVTDAYPIQYLYTFYGVRRYTISIDVSPSTSRVDAVLIGLEEYEKMRIGLDVQPITIINQTSGDKIEFIPSRPGIYILVFRLKYGEFANINVKIFSTGLDEQMLFLSSLIIFIGMLGCLIQSLFLFFKSKD